jgi:hypothetical protein
VATGILSKREFGALSLVDQQRLNGEIEKLAVRYGEEDLRRNRAASREEGYRRAAPFLFPVSLFPCSSPTP